MTTYYCDLAQDFDNPANVGDASGNPALGPGGLLSMTQGWGNHDKLAAGDTLLITGTADLAKLVKITVDTDKAGSWAISDVVENHNDGGGANGDDWVGELVYISATILWVQINAASTDYASVDTADGVYNVTQADEIAGANMTAKACPGIDTTGGTAGDGTDGYVSLIGTTAAWADDGTPFTLDANSKAAECFKLVPIYWRVKNVVCQEATGAGMNCDGTYVILENFIFQNNGGLGLAQDGNYPALINGMIRGNANGANLYSYPCCIGVQFVDNTGSGCQDYARPIYHGCIWHDNGGDQRNYYSGGAIFINCVIDGGGDTTTGHGVDLGSSVGYVVIGCRITHHDKAAKCGIYGTSKVAGYFDFCAFCDNTINYSTGILIDGGHNDTTLVDDGYTDRDSEDFNIATGKELRSEAMELVS